ncbi:aminopeptidase P family protein [Clostridium sp. NSJ-6]|uniref:Aminopeptidase P family protein n=1 Tax=Clostridium hominis TaxID=2763036 RepID=A0ABR7DEX7_9CLOT|nr:aminopeptidase P family protein [Clostridium hominis]MBC5629697.1 aminopeptidase P family protein [Clostridium hominis]
MKRVNKLREIMKNKNIDHYIITSNDPHQSEYVAEHYRGRAYVSGFTGSSGTLLVSNDSSKLWTDGRYFIQAENELKGSGIDLMKMRTTGYPTLEEYIKENVNKGEVIGFDGNCYSTNAYKKLLELSEENSFKIQINNDLLDEIWEDRPTVPKDKIILHDIDFCGEGRNDKLSNVRKKMNELKVKSFILTSLDDIAWLFNIRGNDVKFNPVVMAYAIIKMDEVTLYIDNNKVTDEIISEFKSQNITIKRYEEIISDVKTLTDSVYIDPAKVNASIFNAIPKEIKVIEGINITTSLKAIKNEVELRNLENCQVRDGVAMVRFIKWLKESIGNMRVTEISATKKLSSIRAEGKYAKGDSFGTIAGYKEHAAMMHYSANEESDYEILNEGMFLVDSGGQYLDGTTDITRTFVMGNITEEEKRDFTLVLKGHINLSMAKFLRGTTGVNLDILARGPLWKYGIDYKCGTGHGVGFFLNVHEGPQGIAPQNNTVVLEPGMILTNEPGIYKEGKYGIRTENTLVVVKDETTEFGDFYRFDTISYCPIDLNGVVKELLSIEELEWLNNYHETVYNKLSPFMNEKEKEFLQELTRVI